MKPRKMHSSPQLLLGLTALLVAGCLLAAVGVSFARYRTEMHNGILFWPDQTAQVYLGYVENNTFYSRQTGWTDTGEQLQLSFAIGNGADSGSCAAMDQHVKLCLLASLGAWQADSETIVYLTVGDQTYSAAAQRITEGTGLHTQFGDGWVFRFQDESGAEPEWILPGGQFNFISMRLEMDNAAITDTSLLQLQVVAEH